MSKLSGYTRHIQQVEWFREKWGQPCACFLKAKILTYFRWIQKRVLQEKYPDESPLYDEMLLEGPIKNMNPDIFDSLDESVIYKAAMNTKGSSGLSLLDADEWRRMIAAIDMVHIQSTFEKK